MNIVTNNILLRHFKKISIFTVDLGTNLKGAVNDKRGKGVQSKIKIRDEFIKKYQSMNNKIIHKYGEIGRLKFYEDGRILAKEIHIYDDDKIYEIEMSNADLEKEPDLYLTEVLQMLEDGSAEKEDENENIVKNITYSNMPEELDRPNIKLPKEQYLEQLVKRRRFIEKTN